MCVPTSTPPARARLATQGGQSNYTKYPDEPDDHAIGRSRGGLSTKIHQLVDGRGRPLVIALTAGQAGDSPMLRTLLEDLSVARPGRGRPRTRPDAVLGDKAYSSRANRELLRTKRVTTVIPQPVDQIAHRQRRGSAGGRPPSFDATTYKARNVVDPPGINGQAVYQGTDAVDRVTGGNDNDTFWGGVGNDRIEGFDLTPFNRFVPNSISISMEAGQIESYSDDIEVFRFDLMADNHRPEERQLPVTARRTGTAIGLLQWLRLQLDDTESFENRPNDTVTPSAWRQVFYPFTLPVELREGEVLTLWAAHDLVSMAFAPMTAT